ncbi:MAG TPA: hypothetical protein VKT77_10830 [Chthonomonadaceae bacterium]|nr:hypothetical protein [Chthonomonadaceae bacterium]
MDKINRREIKRMRHILDQIVSMAEDKELEGGLASTVRRYNAIVQHLEATESLPTGLFQRLDEREGAVSYDQVGAESRMLSAYLEDVIDEEEESGRPDFGPVIALAPFLEHGDLKALIHSHLSGRGFQEKERADSGAGPTLASLVALAPHVSKRDLAEMVEACLAKDPDVDPAALTALAPHLDRDSLSQMLRKHAPGWFTPAPPAPPAPQPPAAPEAGPSHSSWKEER